MYPVHWPFEDHNGFYKSSVKLPFLSLASFLFFFYAALPNSMDTQLIFHLPKQSFQLPLQAGQPYLIGP